MWWRKEISPEVLAALKSVGMFSDLPPRDLERLAAACVFKRFRAQETILEEGAVGLGMFIITAGQVEVFKTHEGRRISLATLGDGKVLGEMALMDDQPRSASAVALRDTETLLLTRDRYRTLDKRRPQITGPISRHAERVRDVNDRFIEASVPEPPKARSLQGAESIEIVTPDGATAATSTEPADHSLVEAEAGWLVPSLELDRTNTDLGTDSGSADDPSTDVLRAPYALAMTSAVGFGESVRLCEVFLRSLDEACGLADGRPMTDALRGMPAGLATAGMRSWEQGRRLPSRLLDTFRNHMRSDWREE